VFTVHDVQGREVRRFDLEDVAPGPLSFQWDGLAQDGTRAAPGVYFGRLTLGSKNAVTRLVVLR
jgi:flagellar hook assembly protein FlgD